MSARRKRRRRPAGWRLLVALALLAGACDDGERLPRIPSSGPPPGSASVGGAGGTGGDGGAAQRDGSGRDARRDGNAGGDIGCGLLDGPCGLLEAGTRLLDSGRDGDGGAQDATRRGEAVLPFGLDRCSTHCDCPPLMRCELGACAPSAEPAYCCSAVPCPAGAACTDATGQPGTCR